MALRKPKRRVKKVGPRRVIATEIDHDKLASASAEARYGGSPYHRPPGSKMGPPVKRTYPHASKCDPKWTPQSAVQALKEAIAAGFVSEEWRGDFPRYAWYRDRDVVYEAVLSNRVAGEYHAYPLSEKHEWPRGMT
jgi:hypothetical protein